MAKKKKAKHKKKVHRQQPTRTHAAGSAAVAAPSAAPADAPLTPAPSPTPFQAPAAAPVRHVPSGTLAVRVSYVAGDVTRIGILATGCVTVELILWYLFTYTGLGSAAYSLIK